jgi:hypothetical protein
MDRILWVSPISLAMGGFDSLHSLLLALFILPALAQPPADPLKDFCRRYGHQTAVIDEKLYIDGGWLYANPIPLNPIPTMSKAASPSSRKLVF